MRVNVAHVSLGLKGFDWSVQEIKIVRYRNRGNEDSSDQFTCDNHSLVFEF